MAETIDNVFENATIEADSSKEDARKAAKKEKNKEIRDSFAKTLAEDPTLPERSGKLSNAVSVVAILGSYKGSGNIKVAEGSTKENRVLEATSATVGYAIKYEGDAPLTYLTEKFTQDPTTGEYVGQVVKATAQPGEVINLSRKYATMFTSIPEIGFTLANGIFHASSKKITASTSLDDELLSYYFRFSDNSKSVNDDDVKVLIEDGEGNIKPEYVDTFGYLNNPKKKKVRGSKEKTSAKFTAQEMCAAYIQRALKDNGVL
jgi:hypothetical protein